MSGDSVTISFDGSDERLRQVLDLVAFEREYCPFLTFTVICEPNHGPIELRLGGTADARRFVGEAFLPLLPDHLQELSIA